MCSPVTLHFQSECNASRKLCQSRPLFRSGPILLEEGIKDSWWQYMKTKKPFQESWCQYSIKWSSVCTGFFLILCNTSHSVEYHPWHLGNLHTQDVPKNQPQLKCKGEVKKCVMNYCLLMQVRIRHAITLFLTRLWNKCSDKTAIGLSIVAAPSRETWAQCFICFGASKGLVFTIPTFQQYKQRAKRQPTKQHLNERIELVVGWTF